MSVFLQNQTPPSASSSEQPLAMLFKSPPRPLKENLVKALSEERLNKLLDEDYADKLTGQLRKKIVFRGEGLDVAFEPLVQAGGAIEQKLNENILREEMALTKLI